MKAYPSIRSLLVMARPHNGLICVLVLLAGQVDRYGSEAGWGYLISTWPAALALFMLCCCAHLVNDLVDLPADRDNRPERPLPAGELAPSQVRLAALLLLLVSLFLGLMTFPHWWVWWLIWSAGGLLYSVGVKGRHPVAAPLWTALVITSCWMAGAGAGGMSGQELGIMASMIWFLYYREIVKGMEDSRGDLLAGYLTCFGRFPGNKPGLVVLAVPLVLGGLFLAGTAASVLGGLLAVAFVLTLVWGGVYLFSGSPSWVSSAGSLLKWTAGMGVGLLVFQQAGW